MKVGYCDSQNYVKDNVFDKFNLEKYITKQLYIPPTDKQNFIYLSELSKQDNITHEIKEHTDPNYSDTDAIIESINKNHFEINIATLKIVYPNGYTINFIDYYTPLKFIGQGSFGLVISVIKKETNEVLAVKIIKKTYNGFTPSNISKEVSILKTLDNNRIMKLHDVIETSEYLFLFMDLVEGGSLKDLIIDRYTKSISGESKYFMTDEEASVIMKGILEGINYIHKNNIMHRDLKPENIMFKNKNDLNSIIIGDFGIADDISCCGGIGTRCGTLIYMAPEMSSDRPYDQLIDLWACGIILYILESGGMHPIYLPSMDKDLYIKETKKKIDWKFPQTFSNLARNLFLKLCKVEPFYRYQTNKSLKHPWITRETDSKIPLTLIESYDREYKIKIFKSMLTCSMYFNIFKSMNENLFLIKQNTTICTNFMSPFDSPRSKKKLSQVFSLIKTSRKNSKHLSEDILIHDLQRQSSKNLLRRNSKHKSSSITKTPLLKVRRFGSVGSVHNFSDSRTNNKSGITNNTGSTLYSSIGNMIRVSRVERSPSLLRLREEIKNKPFDLKERTPLKEINVSKNLQMATKKTLTIKSKKLSMDLSKKHKYYLGNKGNID